MFTVRKVLSQQLSLRFLAAGTLCTGVSVVLSQPRFRTRAEGTITSFYADESTALVIPTLQALSRASRLAKTAMLMAMDYQLAEWDTLQNYLGHSNESDEGDDSRQFRMQLETETDRLRKELGKAQEVYSTKNSHSDLPPVERVQKKKHEKEAMRQCAIALAEAEERLALLGDSKRTKVHRRAANRLMKLCHENRGVYIKIGQHLANLDYLIPQEYIQTLSALFDDNPQTPYNDVCQVIKEEFGKEPHELFDNFDPVPIASASLAQVHVAYDKKTGQKLAVKVQHRGLRETSKGDLYALVTVVRLAEKLFDGFTWGWLADEIAPQLPKELDFNNEGRNAERAAQNLSTVGGLSCVIPEVIWSQTSSRVLTMAFEEGFKATDVDAIRKSGLKKRDVAKLISSVFSSQVFLSSYVHCDPHPANVLLRPNKGRPQIVLVDHGLYRELDPDFRLRYAALWKSLMLADLEGIKEACHNLGVDKAYALFAAMLTARPFDEMIERSKKGSLRHEAQAGSRADQAVIRSYAQRFLSDIFTLLSSVPRQMLLLLKMNDCLRHIDYSLGSPTNTMVVCGEYAARAIYENYIQRPLPWWQRWTFWWSYMHVLLRIRIHDATVWWLEQSGSYTLG